MIRILDKETLTNGIKHLKEVDEDLLLILEQNNDSINLFQRQKGFIGLINLIIEQQLSVASAKAIFGRVQQKIVPFNAHNFYKLSENKLRNAGLSKQKIEYCKGIARAVINKDLNFNYLNTLPDEKVVKCLTCFKGVGDWTANCYLLACLSRADAWPSSDLGLQVSIQKVKKLRMKPNKLTTEKIADPWKPFRSIAALLLWSTYD